jgi:uncharacterized protein
LAQYNLGAMYARGQGVPQDFAQAFDWFGKAADHGNADAQVSLGELYAEGYGVPQDGTVKANKYRRFSASNPTERGDNS